MSTGAGLGDVPCGLANLTNTGQNRELQTDSERQETKIASKRSRNQANFNEFLDTRAGRIRFMGTIQRLTRLE
ncbi:MAG TPA: hypothetical protein VKX41_12470 [Alloacidobacterium sp.]|nr:hypothetical protein [Alloacidobacterium sp.]